MNKMSQQKNRFEPLLITVCFSLLFSLKPWTATGQPTASALLSALPERIATERITQKTMLNMCLCPMTGFHAIQILLLASPSKVLV